MYKSPTDYAKGCKPKHPKESQLPWRTAYDRQRLQYYNEFAMVKKYKPALREPLIDEEIFL